MNPYEQYPLITKIMRQYRDEHPQDFNYYDDAEWIAAEAEMRALDERIKGFTSQRGITSTHDKEMLDGFLYKLNAACEARESAVLDYGFFDGFAAGVKLVLEASAELQQLIPGLIPKHIPIRIPTHIPNRKKNNENSE